METISKKNRSEMEKFHKALAPFSMVYKDGDGDVYDLTIGMHDDGDGWYEHYDEETGGEEFHQEGVLEFKGFDIVGYDGCFELDEVIIKLLESFGFNNKL